jgi:hypothetical protein
VWRAKGEDILRKIESRAIGLLMVNLITAHSVVAADVENHGIRSGRHPAGWLWADILLRQDPPSCRSIAVLSRVSD